MLPDQLFHPNTPERLRISRADRAARTTFVLSITDRCNIKCDFCCHPFMSSEISDADAVGLANQAATLDFDTIAVTGGEPFLRRELLLRLARIAQAAGKRFGIITNAYWARSRTRADKHLRELAASGLTDFTVSWDPSHGAYVPATAAQNAIDIAVDLGLVVTLTGSFKEHGDSHERHGFHLAELKQYENFVALAHLAEAAGNGERLDDLPEKHEVDFEKGPCRCPSKHLQQLVLYARDGLVQPCCSIHAGYKMRDLSLGDWRTTSVEDLRTRHKGDAFFTLACEGGFRRVYEIISELAPDVHSSLPDWRESGTVCHLCSRLMNSSVATEVRDVLENYLLDRLHDYSPGVTTGSA